MTGSLMKEIKLGVSKRLLYQKHPSANILEIDIEIQAPNGEWKTRTSISLTSDMIKQLEKDVE